VIIRSLIVPLLGIGIAYLFFRESFGGAQFAALVAVFCTPVAVSSVPMAQEMNADVSLAGQLVVFTTVSSAFTVFLASFLLKAAGIFLFFLALV
jgi:predicted permease